MEKTKDNLIRCFTCAVQCGYIDITKWMRGAWPDCTQIYQIGPNLGSFGNIVDEYFTTHASAHGQLPMLQDLVRLYYDLNDSTYIIAAKNGHLDLLKWMCPENHLIYRRQLVRDMAEVAAYEGQTHVLKWLEYHIDVYRCDAFLFQKALQGGHLNTVQWLKDNGFLCKTI
jgi:hypothetical protein